VRASATAKRRRLGENGDLFYHIAIFLVGRNYGEYRQLDKIMRSY